jgi:hypothetical protein
MMATEIAVQTRMRTIDAIHVASALRVGGSEVTAQLLTYDLRQASGAKAFGLNVVGN